MVYFTKVPASRGIFNIIHIKSYDFESDNFESVKITN